MKRKHILGGILAAALAAGLVYYYGGSQVPVGQSQLQSLTPQNVNIFTGAFNSAQGDVRVVLLLSPT